MNKIIISHPTTDVEVPSTKKKIKIRPTTVKEEKILLMSKETGDRSEILQGIRDVLSNCIQTSNFNIEALTLFDLEYLFVKLRAFSVSNKITQSYKDNEDDKVYDIEIDLDKVEVKYPEKEVSDTISIDKNLTLKLSYPTISLYANKEFFTETTASDSFNMILKSCDPQVYQGDEVIKLNDLSKEEFSEFVDNLSSKVYKEINKFLDSIPTLYIKLGYTNSAGTEREIVLKSLEDFFIY